MLQLEALLITFLVPVYQLIPKSGSPDFGVISVFIISTASVILNTSITMKIFGLEYDEPDFAFLPRRTISKHTEERPLPQTLDSLPGTL